MLEILSVVAIIAAVLGALIYKSSDAVRRSRANSFIRAVREVETGLLDKVYTGSDSFVPLTGGGTIPVTGALLSTTTPSVLQQETTLEPFLRKVGALTLSPSFPFAAAKNPGSQLDYNPGTKTFFATPDRVISAQGINSAAHFEAQLSNPASAPSAATGTNFRLNGITDLPANAVVVAAVLPNISARDALALAEANLPRESVPALNAACDKGRVAYAAPNAAGITTAYVYVTHR